MSSKLSKYIGINLILLMSILAFATSEAQTRSLFNGKNFNGWHADIPKMDTVPKAINPFIIRDGMIVSLGTPGGHLITDVSTKILG